jgi:hypothetical protein
MAYKPWYEQAAEINNQGEREEFIRGVFGFRPTEKRPAIASLIAGTTAAYLAGAVYVVSKAKAKAKKKK